ncbi:MAG: tRNA lysidine(34) synthetase TilS, partial [Oceanicaulis sp.]
MTPIAPRIGLALSGGGDSTALLLALREAAPELALFTYTVDHALRPDSAREARAAAAMAERAGASARILTWPDPRPGQNQARRARHRLLAEACRADGVEILCLAHTLDDRIETLRMRAARPGPDTRLAGPGPIDPSPAWPEGRGLTLARPFLGLTRGALRRYLALRGASWIEDPTNADPAYERVRLRQAPLSEAARRRLLADSDAARAGLEADRRRAAALIGAAVGLDAWGGARI